MTNERENLTYSIDDIMYEAIANNPEEKESITKTVKRYKGVCGTAQMTNEEVLDCIQKYRETGDVKYKNKVVTSNIPLVLKYAYPMQEMAAASNGRVDMDDVISEGILGLAHAVDLFDFSYNTRFSTYAVAAIRDAVRKCVRRNLNDLYMPRERVTALLKFRKLWTLIQAQGYKNPEEVAARELNISVEKVKELLMNLWQTTVITLDSPPSNAQNDDLAIIDVVADDSNKPIEDTVEQAIEDEGLRYVIESLEDDRLKAVIKMRYGIAPFKRPMTLAEVAFELDVCRERVRQLEFKALRTISDRYKKYLKTRKIEDTKSCFVYKGA